MSEPSPAYTVRPGARLSGALQLPGDKSISHRAVILGSLAAGVTRVSGLLGSGDVLATLAAMRALGVTIEGPRDGVLEIHGAGLHGLQAPAHDLDLGNSGTAMRLLAGVLAAQPFASRLVGDASLSKRPMERVLAPLRRMGAELGSNDGCAPLVITPASGLQAIRHTMKVASAQVKSALLLAGLYAEGGVTVCEPAPTRDHTEKMLLRFGARLHHGGERCVTLEGGAHLHGQQEQTLGVPADLSSAAFFIVGAAITPGSDLVLRGVGVNPTRTGVIEILRAMGARIGYREPQGGDPEAVADIRVRYAPLRGIRVDPGLVPLAIDEFPAIAVAAACAAGETVIDGAAELRVKESDRIHSMVRELGRLGVDVEELPEGMVIRGRGGAGLRGATVHSHGDHRVAMALAMAGAVAAGPEPLRVLDCANVATSFPGFAACARAAGLALEESYERDGG